MELKTSKNYYLIKKENLKNVKGYYYPNNFKVFLTSKDYKDFLKLSSREQKAQAKILDLEMRKNIIVRINNAKVKKVAEVNNIVAVKKVAEFNNIAAVKKVKKAKKDKIIKILVDGFKNITSEKLLIKYADRILSYEKANAKNWWHMDRYNKFGKQVGKSIYIFSGQLYQRKSLNADSFKELEYDKDGLLIQKKAKIENKKLLINDLTNISKLGFSKWIPKMKMTEQQAEEFANTNLNKMIEVGIIDIDEIKGKFYSFAGFVSKDGKINKKLVGTLTEMRIIDPHGKASRKLNWNDLTLLNTFEFEQEQNGTSDIIIDDTININDRKTIKKDTAIIKFIELRKKGMNSRNHKDFNVSYREYMTLRDNYKEFKNFERQYI